MISLGIVIGFMMMFIIVFLFEDVMRVVVKGMKEVLLVFGVTWFEMVK